jgi:CRP/FNR family cyclic AMP-dependent transcriptional regulator
VNTARLREVPLFAGLGKKDLEALGRIGDELDVREGKALVRQGELGHEFFVLESGTATVEIDGDKVGDLGPGDFFGEIALIEEDRRTATVTAASDATVIVINGPDFRGLKRTMPKVYETVHAEISKRRPVSA